MTDRAKETAENEGPDTRKEMVRALSNLLSPFDWAALTTEVGKDVLSTGILQRLAALDADTLSPDLRAAVARMRARLTELGIHH